MPVKPWSQHIVRSWNCSRTSCLRWPNCWSQSIIVSFIFRSSGLGGPLTGLHQGTMSRIGCGSPFASRKDSVCKAMTGNVKRLIVTGDDFGLSAGVNQGIASAHEQGILTSASLMVRWPAAEAAASYARSHPALSVGLHLDLAEWTFKDESWHPVYQVAALDNPSAVAVELEKQLRRFTELVGREP